MAQADPKTKPAPAPLTTSIFVALAAIMRDIRAIAKDQQNKAQGFNFRGIDDFYNGLHDIFAAHGVVTMPEVLDTVFAELGKNAKGNAIYCARVRVKYHFIATDGTTREAIGAGEAYDFGDKALNKAMSMAHKYVLAQTFQIPTLYPDADSYTYDQTVDPTRDPFAGKSLKQLEAVRDAQLEAGMKSSDMAPLLGRIAELRVEEQDAADALGAPGATGTAGTTAAPAKTPDKPAATTKPAATAKTDKPAATAKPAAEKKPAAPAAPPVEKDTPPGAAEDEFSESAEDPAPPANDKAAAYNAALEFVVEEKALKHKDYVGKRLADLSPEHIHALHEKWVLKFADEIAKNPDKVALRDAVLLVHASLPPLKK